MEDIIIRTVLDLFAVMWLSTALTVSATSLYDTYKSW